MMIETGTGPAGNGPIEMSKPKLAFSSPASNSISFTSLPTSRLNRFRVSVNAGNVRPPSACACESVSACENDAPGAENAFKLGLSSLVSINRSALSPVGAAPVTAEESRLK